MADKRTTGNSSIFDETDGYSWKIDTDQDGHIKSKIWDGTNEVDVLIDEENNYRLAVDVEGFAQIRPVLSLQAEYTGQQTNTVVLTPALGKKFRVTGVTMFANKTGSISMRVHFGNPETLLIWTQFQSTGWGAGAYMPINVIGAVDESIYLDTTGLVGASVTFLAIQYEEID